MLSLRPGWLGSLDLWFGFWHLGFELYLGIQKPSNYGFITYCFVGFGDAGGALGFQFSEGLSVKT